MGPDRGRAQDDRHRSPRAAEGHRLRRRAHHLPPGGDERGVRAERARALRRRDVGPERRPDQRRVRRRGHPLAADRPAEGRRQPRRHRWPRARPVRGVPVGGGVRLGRVRAAPQDLPRARRRVQPAARPDPRGRAALRAGLQHAASSGGRAENRGGVRDGAGDRRPAGAPGHARRPARAARLRLRRGRHPRGRRGDRARRTAVQPAPGDGRGPAPPAARGLGGREPRVIPNDAGFLPRDTGNTPR